MYEGKFNAYVDQPGGGQKMVASELPPPPEGSYEAVLAGADAPLFALDLRDLDRDAPQTAWLFGPRLNTYFVGASYSPTDPSNNPSLEKSVLADEYDLLIFVEETSPSRFLPVTLAFGFPVETERASDPSGRLTVPLLSNWSVEMLDTHTLLTSPDGTAQAYLLSAEGNNPDDVLEAAWKNVAADATLEDPMTDAIPPGFAGTARALLYPLEGGGSAVGAL